MDSDLSPDIAIDQFLARLKRAGPLLVALSGGSDSMALLRLLNDRSSSPTGRQIIAVTVDHGLRSESASEARWIASQCDGLGIKHRIVRWKGRKPKRAVQEAARLARYSLLREVSETEGAAAIVTGHTRDDQIETVLMRSSRGIGRGLAGMAESTLFSADTWVLRPLLAVRKQVLRDKLLEFGAEWIEDPSNNDAQFERVRVRQSIGSVRPDHEILEMIAQRAAARRDDATHLARFIGSHARLHHGIIAELPQVPPEMSEYLQQAIGLFASLMGGRSHRPGATLQRQIDRFSADIGPPRVTLGRSVLDRRSDRIFVYRETRGQKKVRIGSGKTIVWDNRYRMENQDNGRDFVVAPTPSSGLPTDFSVAESEDMSHAVPPGVWSRARRAEPSMYGGAKTPSIAKPLEILPSGLTVARYLALFDQFLPEFDHILAVQCAELFGRTPYPETPLTNG